MIICIAQMQSSPGDIDSNILHHKKFIEAAAANKANLIMFPELSLTNYEPELAKLLAMQQDDPRLTIFQELSNIHHITIALGLPTRGAEGVFISLIFFQPEKTILTYSKKYLHKDEEPFFARGKNFPTLRINDLVIAPAICYEISIQEHAATAFAHSPAVYLASVSKTETGMTNAIKRMKEISLQYNTVTCICNSVGPSDNFVAAGRSCVIDKKGEIMAELLSDTEGFIIFDTQSFELREVILENWGLEQKE